MFVQINFKNLKPFFFLHKVFLCGVFFCASSVFAFPTTATLRTEAIVRSGPGESFYETSRLKIGDDVQVHRVTEDGWCAIRPPIGSFSWVSGRALQVGIDNVGVATSNSLSGDPLSVRIGSDSSDLCSAIQISLRQGEKVMVIDRATIDSDIENPLWYKISPPSGEFRYVHRDAIDFSETKNSPAIIQPVIQPVAYQFENTAREISTSAAPLNIETQSIPFAQTFHELREEVGRAMRQPTEDWVFETLHAQAKQLVPAAPTEQERVQLEQMVLALSRTQQIRKELAQRRTLAQMTSVSQGRAAASNVPSLLPTQNSLQNSSLAPGALPIHPANQIPVTATPHTMKPVAYRVPAETASSANPFAIEGILGRFSPAPEGYPPYAILDAQQQVTCLVTPQRGVILEQLVGKRVGLGGALGVYQTSDGASLRHISANTAIAL